MIGQADRRDGEDTVKQKTPPKRGLQIINPGSVLALQDVAIQLLSPLRGLTAVFEMGTGVSPSPWPPELKCQAPVLPCALTVACVVDPRFHQ